MNIQELFAAMRREAKMRARNTVRCGLDPAQQERRLMKRYEKISYSAREEFMKQHQIACYELGNCQRRANDN